MKKYIVFILVLTFSFLLSGCYRNEKPLTDLEKIIERGYIIIGVKTDSPPFGYYKDNNLVGIDIELSKKIAAAIFESDSLDHVRFEAVTPQNRISKLNAKEVDILVATMSVNEKRKLVIDFSTPYFKTNQKILVKKTSKINHLNYFNKKGRLAVIMGTTGERIVRLVIPNAQIVGAKSYREAFNFLYNNQVDAILGDDCILNGLKTDEFRIVNRIYNTEHYAVAVRKSENSKEMLNIINPVIMQFLDKKMYKNL